MQGNAALAQPDAPTATAAIEVAATAAPTQPDPPTSTPEPATQIPTATPEPSNTPAPTDSPIPTVKPRPKATSTRTRTPLPAYTATPEAVTQPSPTAIPEEAAAPHRQTPQRPLLQQVLAAQKGYDAYIPAATKKHQDYHYSCEFDAAWVVFKTYGFDVSLDEQVSIMGVDKSIEPRWEETKKGIFIYGGDITDYYSGDYKTNFLARSSGAAMAKVFEHFNLKVTPVHDQASVEQALLSGSLVWVKVPVDFKTWRPATWVMPDGRTYQTVLGNDHAVVLMGFNKDVVVIRDVLGPTSTNWNRKYEYEVPWSKFLPAWGAQSYDGLAVAPPGAGN